MKKIIKKYIFASVCLIFLTTKTSVYDVKSHEVKRIVYPSFINSAAAGAIVGTLAPTVHGSLFIVTLLTSPLYNAIPLCLALINVITTLKKEGPRIVGFHGYYPTIKTINLNNFVGIVGIASVSFLVTIFTYYTSCDIANSLKRTCVALYKKLTA